MFSLDRLNARTLLRLEADLSHHTLDEFVERIRQHYGLANSVYVCPSFPGRSLIDPYVTATYSPEWISHYRTQRYVSIDPVVNIGARSALPLDWARLPRRTKKAKRLFGEAKEAGVGHQGLTIPVRGPANGLWALFIATSNESDSEWAARRYELMRDITLVAYYAHQRAYELHAKEEPVDLNGVTQREIEALECAAEGKSVEDMAILMRISAVTVRAHLDSARHKLQALNRVHAVTKALRAGLIH
ncbi:LuxR family transcriptional regulator (plasmid) [Methylocapsa polymorpha]|uniref:LuxR family transcriptional regulator n=1 Tax=Methylocapsa polymorpha TaxID=3080828 RepID=A0ABZ0HYJ0_9HYPH|nr:LuxR family transcriptional regulator [Methylocapsa sp. RX1]WOJ91649.1 LuxR family transcriptional regulator [Methylocapsa sp. RX1]